MSAALSATSAAVLPSLVCSSSESSKSFFSSSSTWLCLLHCPSCRQQSCPSYFGHPMTLRRAPNPNHSPPPLASCACYTPFDTPVSCTLGFLSLVVLSHHFPCSVSQQMLHGMLQCLLNCWPHWQQSWSRWAERWLSRIQSTGPPNHTPSGLC